MAASLRMTQEKRKYFGENGNDLKDAVGALTQFLGLTNCDSYGIDTGGEDIPDDEGYRRVAVAWLQGTQAALVYVQSQNVAAEVAYQKNRTDLLTAFAEVRWWKDHGGK